MHHNALPTGCRVNGVKGEEGWAFMTVLCALVNNIKALDRRNTEICRRGTECCDASQPPLLRQLPRVVSAQESQFMPSVAWEL